MPSCLRRRKGLVYFRRKVPENLKKRIGVSELTYSLGRIGPRDARRLLNYLWGVSEYVFMELRENPGITPEDLIRLHNGTQRALDFQIKKLLAATRPDRVRHPLDDPGNQAGRQRGIAALLKNLLDKNDLGRFDEIAAPITSGGLKKEFASGSDEERLATRAIVEGARASALKAASAFETMAAFYPKSPRLRILADDVETKIDFRDLEVLADPTLANEVRLRKYLALNPLVECGPGATELEPAVAPAPGPPAPASASLLNEDKKISELWSLFVQTKITKKQWRKGEAKSSTTTRELFTELRGDLSPKQYTTLSSVAFMQTMRALPAETYHRKEFRDIYLKGGVRALVDFADDMKVARISDKTWNKHCSRLNEFFLWCAKTGLALSKETASNLPIASYQFRNQ
jgi:hypothetical protein